MSVKEFYSKTEVDELLSTTKAELMKKIEDSAGLGSKVVIESTASTEDILEIFKKYRNIEFTKNATYDLTSGIVVYSDTVVDLNGAVLRRMCADNVMEAYVDPDTTIGYSGVHDVVIKNGTLEGMNNLGLRSTNLTSWMHCKNLTFENVTFLDTPGCHSADLVGCCDVTFLNCKFLGYYSHGSDFRESIQIDYAAYCSLPSFPADSVCYDLTYCKNVIIDGCVFDKSDDRPAQYCAIGAHSEGNDYNYHQDIIIRNCTATGNGVTSGSPSYGSFLRCMKFKNTLVQNNKVGNYGRMIWITMPGSLYNADGSAVPASENTDKILNVENLVIMNNEIVSKGSTWQSYGMYIKDTFKKSKNIIVQDFNVPETAVYINGCENVLTQL